MIVRGADLVSSVTGILSFRELLDKPCEAYIYAFPETTKSRFITMADQIEIRFGFHRAGKDVGPTEAYVGLIAGIVSSPDASTIFNCNASDLVARAALIATALAFSGASANPELASGLHVVEDGAGQFMIQGFVTAEHFRRQGVGKTLLAATIVHLHETTGVSDFGLTTRLDAKGRPNPRAYPLFCSLGLKVVDRKRVEIVGGRLDAHLRASAEGSGTFFHVLAMHGGRDTVEIARRLLGTASNV
jgi:GNAT superfamily N-acetyltransferase